MNWIEILMIAIGISMDVFAVVECQGALVARIRKKHLALIIALVSACQLVSLSAGYGGAALLIHYSVKEQQMLMGRVLAVIIFFGMAARLLLKACKNERIDERREDELTVKRFFKLSALNSIYIFLIGAAFAFLGTSMVLLLGIILVITVLCVVTGIYTGYHFGYEQKTKVYLIGAVLLVAGGIDVIIRYIL